MSSERIVPSVFYRDATLGAARDCLKLLVPVTNLQLAVRLHSLDLIGSSLWSP